MFEIGFMPVKGEQGISYAKKGSPDPFNLVAESQNCQVILLIYTHFILTCVHFVTRGCVCVCVVCCARGVLGICMCVKRLLCCKTHERCMYQHVKKYSLCSSGATFRLDKLFQQRINDLSLEKNWVGFSIARASVLPIVWDKGSLIRILLLTWNFQDLFREP